jgi:hypothetical protein
MAEVISTAGLGDAFEGAKPEHPRRDAIRVIRATLRNQTATDDEVDDALDALVELAKD